MLSRRWRRSAAAALVAALGSGGPSSALPDRLGEAVRDYRVAHEPAILAELLELLALPNPASDRAAVRRNAEHLRALLERRGVAARLLEPAAGGAPAVYGELASPGAERTVVLYAHYDGQPVEPGRWATPPFEPVVRDGVLEAGARVLAPAELRPPLDPEWRVYARSASDDKAPIVALLAALDALRSAGAAPGVHLKFFFEGEEEAGSPHLAELLRTHHELLAADLWLFCDGPVHPSGRQQVVFGVRGVVGLEMTLYGPLQPLHSGHYGNWAPNPAAELAELLAGMRDSEGRILIDGFADAVRPLPAEARQALDALPRPEGELRRRYALGRVEGGGAGLAERILEPALNVRGIASGEVGALAKNAVPTEARASIDFRLVPDQTPAEVRRLVETHLRGRGYRLLSEEPAAEARAAAGRLVRLEWDDGYPALRTPLDLPASRAVVAAVEEAIGEPVLRVPGLGGSLPLYLFREVLDVPLIVVPIVNHDNNQHAPNENVRLANLWRGVEVYARLMARLGDLWP